jgi:hypothetical protein
MVSLSGLDLFGGWGRTPQHAPHGR